MKRKITTFLATGAAAVGGAFLLTGAGSPLAHDSATNLEAYDTGYSCVFLGNTWTGGSYCAGAKVGTEGVYVCSGYMDIYSDNRSCQKFA